MRIGDDQQVELLDALRRFRHARDGVAAVPLTNMAFRLSFCAT